MACRIDYRKFCPCPDIGACRTDYRRTGNRVNSMSYDTPARPLQPEEIAPIQKNTG